MTRRNKLLAAAALAAVGTLGTSAAFAQGISFNGYLRTGVGGTSEGGNLQCFDAGWPIRAKYRLGNECDTYGEAQISAPFGKQDGAYGKYVLMLALTGGDDRDFSNVKNDDRNFDIANRQNYFQFGGVFPKGGALEDAKVWIGKRYYNRHDVHINDHFYWNNSGQGAGIEDISVGPAKLAFAYHQKDGNANAKDAVMANRYSARFYGLSTNPGGTLEGELVLLKGTTAGSAKEGSGTVLFLEHTQSGILGGYNKLALVTGSKLGAGFEWIPTEADGGEAKGSQLRILDTMYVDLKNGWSGQAVVGYGRYKDGNDTKYTWITAGVRPQYNFNDNYSLAVEVGYDQGKISSGDTKKIAKVTVAPQIALAPGFWSRPVMRAFVTHAKWNDTVQAGGIANGVFGDKKSGTTYGLQVEAWW